MNTPNIITWLRDQTMRAPEDVHKRGMIQAAAMLERLEANLKTAVNQRNEYQEKYLAEHEWNATLEAELKTERHRTNRLKAENVAMAAELKKAGGCGACKHCYSAWDEDPCDSCRQDTNFPGWEWQGREEGTA